MKTELFTNTSQPPPLRAGNKRDFHSNCHGSPSGGERRNGAVRLDIDPRGDPLCDRGAADRFGRHGAD